MSGVTRKAANSCSTFSRRSVIACLTGIFFVMLIPFCAFSELSIVLGEGKLARLFFSRVHNFMKKRVL